ncbi:MAG: nuclear transport factor 2 family protein [Idiomarina sp.]|nr:nuclear transport factor 2 family protein [Idiomarina sp.]
MSTKIMLLATICIVFSTSAPFATAQSGNQQTHPLQAPIQERLDWFMHGASVGDGDVHGEFWHPDLTYTSSAGSRFGKQELMQGMWGSAPLQDQDVTSWYRADELKLTVLGDTVIVNFILVAEPVDGSESSYFYNSGVLIEDEGEWRAINWHATHKDTTNAD